MSRSGVMIMAAGTGGHIFPGLAVAERLKADGAEVSWLGTPNGMENRLVSAAGIELEQIDIDGLRGRGLGGWLRAPLRVLRAGIAARRILRQRRPACVLSMGGYVAGPGALAARSLGIPLLIHEQNAIAGLTNRLLAPLAARILSGFPDGLRRAEPVGNPVRDEISALAEPAVRFAGRQGPLRLVVVGGSLGARAFARIVPAALARLPVAQRPAVLHQAGRELDATRLAYAEAGVEANVVGFIDDMAGAWGEADLAVCRAGALTVSELACVGLAAVLVPFPHAVDDHQFVNAGYLADAGAAWRIREQEFSIEWLADKLVRLDRAELLTMAEKGRSQARSDAAAAVAQACREVMA